MKTYVFISAVFIIVVFAALLKNAFVRIGRNEEGIRRANNEIEKIKDDYLTKADFVAGISEINNKLDRLIEKIKKRGLKFG